MNREVTSENLPIKLWLDNIEDKALDQAKALANLPFAFKHISLMPDAHFGYGMPIGGVLATRDVIIPNAVGKDIGCGMCAIKTDFTYKPNRDTLISILQAVRQMVPMGVGKYRKTPCDASEMPKLDHTEVIDELYQSATRQLGTLGSGNHFIEIQRDAEDGRMWLMLHSGSRGLGNKVAIHYDKLAKKINKKDGQVFPELAWFDVYSDEGYDYIRDMNYCAEFAELNRMKMMYQFMMAVERCFKKYDGHTISFPYDMVNVAHNYAVLEEHFHADVWVHRKGATSAQKGQTGIIPGSQGTPSYIVEGLGNPDSFNSCSHGAGRTMGRKAAQQKLNLADEQKLLDDKGIIHSIRCKRDLDEAVGAYKDIDEVINNQKDLVKIISKLEPIAATKG